MENTIPMKPCQSSSIAAYGYDEATKTLALQFKSGKAGTVYQYVGVTPELYTEMCEAQSLGVFVRARILGRFEPTKIAPEPKPAEENKEATNGVG